MAKEAEHAPPASGVRLRRFERTDLPRAVHLWAGAFGVSLPDRDSRENAQQRLAFSLDTDPAGSFIAEHTGELIGLAQALVRERLWVLSSLAVDARARGRGVGGALLERAFAYGASCDARLVVSSDDPSAMALYARTGLALRRTVQAEGEASPTLVGDAARAFRVGGPDDLTELEPISRAVRGAPHTREIGFALERGDARMLVGEGGFAVVRPGQGVWLLAAREEAEAEALLAAAITLAGRCERPFVRWVTEEQGWALAVLERVGLTISRYGGLFVGGEPGALSPFIPSGPFA